MIKNNKLLLIIISAILIVGIFLLSKNKNNSDINYSKIIDYNNIYFAWEKVPLWKNWDNQINKQKFEKELFITIFNIDQFLLYHKRDWIYFPYIEKKLKEAWVPDDFKYLAVAESALKNESLSDAWAGWIWQFIPETGKRYGLEINEYVDERYNYEKETDAAIEYLKKMYKDFWNWTLTAAAYNRWENWLRRALDDQKVNSYYDLYLNKETSRYVWRILAIKYVMENRYKFSFKDMLWEKYKEQETKTINSWKIDNLKEWSIKKWYNYSVIKELNPWIVQDKLPEWNWKIKLPAK